MMSDRPWLKNYPSGIPANINPDEYPNLVAFFEMCFTKYKKKTAFECMGKEITFAELDRQSRAFGAYLLSRGLEPGDKIAIMMPNLLQYPIAVIGALRAGLIVVNTNPLYTPREMEHQFKDSEAKAIVILENYALNLQKIIHHTQIKTVILTSIGELLGVIKGNLVDFTVQYIKSLVPKYEIPNTVFFSRALKEGKSFQIPQIELCPEDVVLLQYTGGTTGLSKGAMLTNRNLIANLLQMQATMSESFREGEEIALSPLPMYHIFAFTVNCLAFMGLGAKTVLITNPRDPGSLIKEFKRNKITLMTGLNTLFNALVNRPDFKELDFSSLKIVVSGGMALRNPVAEKWEALTGVRIAEGYGMTESSPVVCVDKTDGNATLGTIGFPVPSTEVKLVDADGKEVAVGEVGELIVRGPQVMKGYYNKPSETDKTIRNGWLYTGDMATMDEEGYFKIVDRKKDMIIVSGFNVFPNEIEEVIASHPKVLEVAAIGVPDEKSDEAVKIFVVKKDKGLKEKELLEFCRENLTAYKVPKHIEFRTSLPKTTVGKILRRELKNG
jgi:long-chain acyl-CoA synthetase